LKALALWLHYPDTPGFLVNHAAGRFGTEALPHSQRGRATPQQDRTAFCVMAPVFRMGPFPSC